MHEPLQSASQSGTVLIVEDEPKLGQLLVDYLQAAGYSTQWLTNGAEVVAAVRPVSSGHYLAGSDVARQ